MKRSTRRLPSERWGPASAGSTRRRGADAELVFGADDSSLLDVVDNVLNNGVVLSGDLTIGLAKVDLIYAKLSLLLAAADRVLPGESNEFLDRHRARYEARVRQRKRRAE
jgi:hypothetical protein